MYSPIRNLNGDIVWPWYPSQEDWNEAVRATIKRMTLELSEKAL